MDVQDAQDKTSGGCWVFNVFAGFHFVWNHTQIKVVGQTADRWYKTTGRGACG
jgi:hypothetical protein